MCQGGPGTPAAPRSATQRHFAHHCALPRAEASVCLSGRRQLRVTWEDGEPLPRKCCAINIALQVEWHALRRQYCNEQMLRPDGSKRLPSADCSGYLRRRPRPKSKRLRRGE